MSIKLLHELAEPHGTIRSNRKNLSVTVFCHENKSVVIVEKLGFIAIRKNFEDIFETISPPKMRKSSFDIFGGDIVSTAFYAVFDSPNTFLGSVQTDIVQANIVSCLLCAFAKPFRISPRKSCLLREIHAVL